MIEMLRELESGPSYRFQIELRLVRRLAIRAHNAEIDALCLDLDRLSRAGDSRIERSIRGFERALLLLLQGDAALRRKEDDAARRWVDAAATAARLAGLDAVERAALARLDG